MRYELDLVRYEFRMVDIEFVLGDATGLDALVRYYCRSNKLPHRVFYAEWKRFGRMAGIYRNADMAHSGLSLLLHFPGGRGTADMVKRCLDLNIEVRDIL